MFSKTSAATITIIRRRAILPLLKMRIAMLVYNLRPRGGVVHAVHLSEALKRRGADITLISLKRRGLVDDHESFFGRASFPISFIEFDWHEDVKIRLKSMTESLAAGLPRDFDVYHAQDCVCDTALQRLVSEGSITGPTIRTVHHVQGFQNEFMNHCEMAALMAGTEKITVSQYWHDELKSEYGLDSTVIYNGIDAGKYPIAKPSPDPYILFVGGMESRKGLEFAIQALETLTSKDHKTRLIAVARPGFLRTESREWFDHLVERCGLTGRVDIKELVTDDELIMLYSSASVFLLPTRMEGWGIAIMEAMAAGCPVVSSPVGGVTELIADEENGLLVPVGDVAGIASAVERLLDDGRLRERLCASAKRTIAQYTWESAAEKTLQLYEQMIAKR